MAALSSIFQKVITSKARLVLTACPIIFFGATKTRVKPRREVCISKDDDDDDDDDDGIIIETPRAGRKYLLKKDFGNERIESAFKRFLCTGGSI